MGQPGKNEIKGDQVVWACGAETSSSEQERIAGAESGACLKCGFLGPSHRAPKGVLEIRTFNAHPGNCGVDNQWSTC